MASRSGGSYGHSCKSIDSQDETFIISWVVDFKYPDSRIRYPRQFSRHTDRAGALKFCKRWKLNFEHSIHAAIKERNEQRRTQLQAGSESR